MIVDGGVWKHVFSLPGIRLVARVPLHASVGRYVPCRDCKDSPHIRVFLLVPTILRDPTYWCLFEHIKTCSERGIVTEPSEDLVLTIVVELGVGFELREYIASFLAQILQEVEQHL